MTAVVFRPSLALGVGRTMPRILHGFFVYTEVTLPPSVHLDY